MGRYGPECQPEGINPIARACSLEFKLQLVSAGSTSRLERPKWNNARNLTIYQCLPLPKPAHQQVAKFSIFTNASRPKALFRQQLRNLTLYQCLPDQGAPISRSRNSHSLPMPPGPRRPFINRRENLDLYQYLGLTASHRGGYKQPTFLKTGADLKRGADS